MDPLLRQVGDLLLDSVPTAVIFLLLYAIYTTLVGNPLRRLLDERRERTEGAVIKARADISAAESKTHDYEQRLREARLVIFKAQEVRRQAAQKARAEAVAAARERCPGADSRGPYCHGTGHGCGAPEPAGRVRVAGLRDYSDDPEAGRGGIGFGRSGMNGKKRFRSIAAAFLLLGCLFVVAVAAQEHAQPAPQAQSADHGSQQQPVNPDTAASQDLAKASKAAEHAEEGEAHEENAEFKYSSMVQRIGPMDRSRRTRNVLGCR